MSETLQKLSSLERWKRMADEIRAEAEKIPLGRAHDAMIKKLRQLETACQVNEWLASPGLRPPIDPTRMTREDKRLPDAQDRRHG